MKIKRKPKESSSMLMRRFSQKIRESGILIDAKKAQFQEKKKSRNIRKQDALRREKKRKEKQRLRKFGKI